MWIVACRTLVVTLAAGVAVAPAMTARADQADDQYAVAAGHYDRQQWKLAVEEFQAFLQAYPEDRRANQCVFFLGEALLQQGSFDDARERFREYVGREPDGKHARAALFRSGEAAYLTGKFDAAKPDLEAFLAKYPGDRLGAYALPYLGDIALAGNDAGTAAGYFRDGLARFPDGRMQDDCRCGLARALERQGQIEEAERLYLAVAGKPDSSLADAAQFHLGALQYAAGRYDRAAETFSAFDSRLAASSWRPNARLGRGLALLKLDRLAEAAALFDEVLKMNPPAALAAEAALLRGRTLEQLDQSEPALAMYDLVIEKYPDAQQHVDALLAAARLRDKLKQHQQAAALYQRLVNDYPQSPKLDAALYEWAWVLQELDKPDDASRLFERLRTEFPQSRFWGDAACRLAQRSLDAKNYQKAGDLASEVLAGKADPKVREYAAFLRGQINAAMADWPKVREAFEMLVQEFPASQRRQVAEYWIAEAYYRQADYAAAGPRLQLLAEQTKDKPEPWMAMIPLRRAQILAQQNQWSEAGAMAAKIAVEFPDFQQQYEVDYLLGRCLASQADFDGARQAYNRVIRSPAGAKTETAAMAQWMIGETFFHQKDYETALREYQKVEILYAYPTWQAGALLQAGKCHERLGTGKEAAELYHRIVKNYPNTTFSTEAAQRLEGLGKDK